ncbi:hypothetical protein OG21DRAFT_1388874, partial [Imleria badia]
FKTEYHPNSSRAPVYESFSMFGCQAHPPPVIDAQPWEPFISHEDFEFAEITHAAAMSKDLVNKLLHLIWKIAGGQTKTKFSLKSHNNIAAAWLHASVLLTPVSQHDSVTVEYKKKELEFSLYSRPLWDWALDLLQDPLLRPHFVWDAQRLYKHNGTSFERFIHEPWTADRWWDIQSMLPENGVPFAFILYADKTHLSSSGKVKAYPVIVRCGNLPVHIWNGHGIGGGRLVGWLPILPGDSAEEDKLSWTNLKRVLWHESFKKLLDSIIALSKIGFAHECFDDILWRLYLIILILSADYEEQCVMALIRGLNSECPCPICLVTQDKLRDHRHPFPLRTSEESMAQYEFWKSHSRSAGEKMLKAHALCPVPNAFWCVHNMCPHRALCFDPLHYDDLGIFGKHQFGDLKVRIEQLGRGASKKLDDQHAKFPRWRNFSHFTSMTNIFFSDGNKFLDISKQILYTAQNILT